MRMAGRVAAAIEILDEIFLRHRPAAEALKDWGKAHRFAGSGDRHVIGTLVYDSLRNRLSSAARGGGNSGRGVALGTLASVWALPLRDIETLATEPFGPGALTPSEKEHLQKPSAEINMPAWLLPSLQAVFGDRLKVEVEALCERAPIDLRTNTLKCERPKLLEAFTKFGATATPYSPWGLRVPAPGFEDKHINVEAEMAHGLGWFEVQDEASQLAVMLCGAGPDMRVLDLCAGAGGKTLALAAQMNNTGHITAYDRDKHRLRPIFERIGRSGASNIEVIPHDEEAKLKSALPFDLVIVDAPCTGSGTWRRKPDAKWRLTEKQLLIRQKEQRAVLEQAAPLVKKGGKLAYFTCSLLPQENTLQVQSFLKSHPDFKTVPYTDQWNSAMNTIPPESADGSKETLLLSPASHGTDGFFIAMLQRK